MVGERSGSEDVGQGKSEKKSRRPSRGSVTKQDNFSAAARAISQRDQRIERLISAPKRVRIIGGVWKRTPLPVIDAPGLRPTPDRVRETLFNWIEHLSDDLTAVRGLDLFAGTGALGFELASRGARHVTLIESNRRLVDQLLQMRQRLGADQVEVVAGDALAMVARWPNASFDLIFVDPPYGSALQVPALAVATRLIAPGGLIYTENESSPASAGFQPSGLEVVREGRAGRVHFQLLGRIGSNPSATAGRRV